MIGTDVDTTYLKSLTREPISYKQNTKLIQYCSFPLMNLMVASLRYCRLFHRFYLLFCVIFCYRRSRIAIQLSKYARCNLKYFTSEEAGGAAHRYPLSVDFCIPGSTTVVVHHRLRDQHCDGIYGISRVRPRSS